MSGTSLAIEMLLCFFLTLCLLHYYGNWRKQHILVTLAVFVAWFFSFIIVEVLPLDVSDTFYRRCLKEQEHRVNKINSSYRLYLNNSNTSTTATVPTTTPNPAESTCEPPWSHLPANVLPDLWRVVYWSSQILSWLILPIMQSYSYAGDFTVRGKIKTALLENAIWYGSYLVIFMVLLIYVIARPDLELNGTQLKIIGITASNTWGLLLLVILMGYGLVEIPRNVWNSANLDYKLAHAYFKVSKLSVEREEAEEQLADVLEEVRKASDNIRYRDPLREFINVIIQKCPESAESMFGKGTDDYVDYDDYLKESGQKVIEPYTEKYLVKLHRKVIVVTQTSRRTQCQYNSQLENAFELEDVMRNAKNTERYYKSSLKKSSKGCCSDITPVFEWYWRIWICPILLRILGIILFLLSLALVWSEVTFFTTKPILSLCAIFINAAGNQYFYFYVEVVSFFIIAYMCVCSYYTVFKMRIFNYYYFAPNHHTDPYSLLFSGLILCRLTYALSLNFLAMIHLDGHVTGAMESVETSFTTFMGHMDVLSFISKGVNLYYPMCVLLVCLATFFSFGTRCLNILGFQTFIIDGDMSVEYTNEGKDIVRREKRRRETGDGRVKETWTERGESAKRRINERKAYRELNLGLQRDQANSQTNLTDDVKVVKYSRFDHENDRVELLAAVDYDPNAMSSSSYGREPYNRDSYNTRDSHSGYGWSPTKPPKNLFDDI